MNMYFQKRDLKGQNIYDYFTVCFEGLSTFCSFQEVIAWHFPKEATQTCSAVV